MTGPCAFAATFFTFAAGLIGATEAPPGSPGSAPSPQPVKDKVAVYSGAAVINGLGEPLRPDMAIITCGERIEAIGALRSARLISAMSMGQQAEMGTLEPGKLATIVCLSANPLENVAAVRNVFLTVKRGARYPRGNYVPITKTEVEGRR